MTDDPHSVNEIPLGTPVTAFDGSLLGYVRDIHPHYLLVGRDGDHTDLEIPVHAIRGLADGRLQVSVNREAVSEVDDQETLHHPGQD